MFKVKLNKYPKVVDLVSAKQNKKKKEKRSKQSLSTSYNGQI